MSPLVSEMPRIRGGVGNINRVLCTGIKKVRRALFEPADHVETEKFLQQELALCTRNECNKWEFDFIKGMPYNANNNKRRFAWKPITSVKIAHAPKKRLREEECFDNSDLYPTLPEKIVRLDAPTERMEDEITTVEVVPKIQSKITDFMQSRKRPSDLTFTKKSSPLSSYINLKNQQKEKS